VDGRSYGCSCERRKLWMEEAVDVVVIRGCPWMEEAVKGWCCGWKKLWQDYGANKEVVAGGTMER
jgi:hypothetical protein